MRFTSLITLATLIVCGRRESAKLKISPLLEAITCIQTADADDLNSFIFHTSSMPTVPLVIRVFRP